MSSLEKKRAFLYIKVSDNISELYLFTLTIIYILNLEVNKIYKSK